MERYRRPEDLNRKDSEAGIIATLIHHPDFVYHSEFLLPEHFVDKQNRLLYEAIRGMAEDGMSSIDVYGIQEYVALNYPNTADQIDMAQLDDFISMSSAIARHSAKDYKILVSNVYDIAFRREMIVKMDECKNVLLNPGQEEDIRKYVYDAVDSVMTSYVYNDDVETYLSKLDALWDEIEKRQGNGYSGIPFKISLLNEFVTMERGELVIFGGQQKSGKSMLLLNCAVDLIQQGYSVLYIDSELSDRLFTARILTYLSGVEYKLLTTGRYSEEDKQKIIDAREWLKNQKFEHIYFPMMQGEDIYRAVKRVNHTMPIDVLIIDYFKSSGNEGDAFQTYAELGRITDIVKNELAGKMNIAAIGAAQTTVQNRLADSAKIARNASTIVMIVDKTPEEIEEDGEECGNKKLIVTANRNGMQHAPGEYISANFDGNHILWEQAAKQAIPQIPY